MKTQIEISEHYVQQQVLHEDGPWATVEAIDQRSDELVVLELVPNEGDQESFLRKLDELVTLRHSCLPAILGGGAAKDGRLFLVREPIEGRTFDTLVGEAPAQIASLLMQVIGGLDLLAERGVYHSALSTSNLWVSVDPSGARAKMLSLAGGIQASVLLNADEVRLRRRDVQALGRVACTLLGATVRDGQTTTPKVELPLAISFELEDAETLRRLLERCLSARDGAPVVSYPEISDTLFRALWGRGGVSPGVPAARLTFSTTPQDELMRSPVGAPPSGQPQSVLPEGAEVTRVVLPEDLGPWPPAGDDPEDTADLRESPLDQEKTRPGLLESTRPGVDGNTADESTRPGLEETRPGTSAPEAEQVFLGLGDVDSVDEMLAPVAFASSDAAEEEPPELPPHLAIPAPPPDLTAEDLGGDRLPEPPAGEPASAAVPPPPPVTRSKSSSLAKAALIAAALGVVVVAALLAVWWSGRTGEAPPTVVETPPPAPPVAAPAVPEEPVPLAPVNADLLEARELLAQGEDEAVREILSTFGPAEEVALGPADCELMTWLAASVDRLDEQRFAEGLEEGYRAGSLTRLRNVLVGLGLNERNFLERHPGSEAALARARRIDSVYTRARRASRAGQSEEVLQTTAQLRQIFPAYEGAESLRETAAEAMEQEAERLFEQGRIEGALEHLEALAALWSGREGLDQRIRLYRTRQQVERNLDALLDSAEVAAEEARFEDGLALLTGVAPPERLRGRLTELRRRLRSGLEAADRQAPTLELRSGSGPEYAKDTSAFVVFVATDDYRVDRVAVSARVEGGAYEPLSYRRDGSEYTVEVPPDFHRNGTVQYFVVAEDVSGHATSLGSAEGPLELKRKRWFHRLRPN
ncbi:MAG: hypothetical protein AAF481_06645 [Acidobacteriota bacterium]